MSTPSGDANLLRTTLRKQQRNTMAGQHLPVLNSCPSTSARTAASVPGQATDQRWDRVELQGGEGPSQLAQTPSQLPAPQMDTGGKTPSPSLAQVAWGPRKEARACQALRGEAGEQPHVFNTSWQQDGYRHTHPLLLMPVHLQRRPAVPACPPGHEGVLVVPEHHLLLLRRGGGGLGGNIIRPRGVQPMDGVGQQLAVAHSDQLPGLRAHTPHR